LALCHLLEQVWIFDVILDRIGDGIMSLGGVVAPVSIHRLLLPLLLHQALQLTLIFLLIVDAALPILPALALQLLLKLHPLLILALSLLPGAFIFLSLVVLL
jgi:hypothetical protein